MESNQFTGLISKSLCLLAGICFLIAGCAPKAETAQYNCGEFSFSYSPKEYALTEENVDGDLTSVILYSLEKPFNRLEFNIFRYKPEMVETILPADMVGELNLDVEQVSERATAGLEITDQSGLLATGRPGRTYEACNIMAVKDENGTEALVSVTSTQVAHYNIIAIAWAESEEKIGKFAEVFESYQVSLP